MSGEHRRVRLAASAKADLKHIGKKYGKRTYETIRDLIKDLAFDPEKKGEPLRGLLHGLYSCHYSRFRIIYRIERGEFVVVVIGAGFHEADSRADIYQVIKEMLKSGALVIQDEVSRSLDEPVDPDEE